MTRNMSKIVSKLFFLDFLHRKTNEPQTGRFGAESDRLAGLAACCDWICLLRINAQRDEAG